MKALLLFLCNHAAVFYVFDSEAVPSHWDMWKDGGESEKRFSYIKNYSS